MAETLLTAPVPAPPTAPPPEAPPSGAAPAPTAPTAPVAPTAPTAWHAQLPDDVKALPNFKSLEKFKDPLTLAKSYLHMESLSGRSTPIPGPDAKPEEKAAFYQKLGVPEAPEKYEVKGPEGIPLDPGAVGQWQKAFHRLNLTPEQVAGLTSEFFGSPMGNPQIMHDKIHVEAETALRAKWGGNYDYNIALAQRAAQQIAGPKVMAKLASRGLGSDPDVVEMFRRLGHEGAEDGSIVTDVQGVVGPTEAKQKLDAIYAAIRTDKNHPALGGQGKAAEEAVREEMFRLNQIIAQVS